MVSDNTDPATSACLHKWVEAMFAKLGLMLLAERSQRKSSIRTYMDDIRYVGGLLQQKADGTIDPDRKADLLIMHNNILYLEERCKQIFATVSTTGRRTRSTEPKGQLQLDRNTHSSDAIINLPISTSGIFNKRPKGTKNKNVSMW